MANSKISQQGLIASISGDQEMKGKSYSAIVFSLVT